MKLPKLFTRKPKLAKLPTSDVTMQQYFDSLTEPERVLFAKALADAQVTDKAPKGDGHAVFIEAMSDQDFTKWQHEEEQGWRKIYNKFLNRNG